MTSMEYWPTSWLAFILWSCCRPPWTFPSSDTSLTCGTKDHPVMTDSKHWTQFTHCYFFLAVTCDLTKLWRLSSDPLTSGVMTNTVKWASSSRHTQSRIYSKRNLLSVNQSIILYSSIRNVVCSESAVRKEKKTKQRPIHTFQ